MRIKICGIRQFNRHLRKITDRGENSKADIVLGLDTNLISVAAETGLFAPHQVDMANKVNLPDSVTGKWEDKAFLPFDWGYFAFVYDDEKLSNPPSSLKGLVEMRK